MKRALIVDDNRMERRLIVHILQSAYSDQITFDEANDGQGALSYVSKVKSYDLVVTDLIMPNMEGLELIRKIKAQFPSFNNILAISGGNPYYLTMAKKMGAFAVFTKPLDKERFLYAVSSIFNNHSFQKTKIA